MLMGRETGPLQLLASLLLTGEKGADLVIRGNVVLNSSHIKFLARFQLLGDGRAPDLGRFLPNQVLSFVLPFLTGCAYQRMVVY
jgi:hypothetical protein